jgi:hypothetical protein
MKSNIMVLLFLLISCSNSKTINDPGDITPDESKNSYFTIVDEPKNEGQYWSIESHVVPKGYYTCFINCPSKYSGDEATLRKGRPYTNMCESLAGIVNKAVENKGCDYAIWLEASSNRSYNICKDYFTSIGVNKLGEDDGISLLKSGVFSKLIKGYILTDITNNPESATYATVAAHVYNAIIVDIRDKAAYDTLGLTMVIDARKKTTLDSWAEFKDKCNNKSLVLMATGTSDMKDFAIANNLFYMNISNPDGNHWNLFHDVLDWLAPCSPVYGWEKLDEHSFVQPITERGHLMNPCDYFMNMSLTSLNYTKRQDGALANVINPANRVYSNNDNNKYVSYYLSDGDNIQWIFNSWYDGWFKNVQSSAMKMAFGIPSTNLSMIAPSVYKFILDNQNAENTLVENCGGGYIYIDSYGNKRDQNQCVSSLAKKVAANMRQHRIKVLGLFTNDAKSESAKKAYETFIKANNLLEGIIVIQYYPYNGGHGTVYWYKNSDGIEIPVITIRYSLWNFGKNNSNGQGTPAYVASLLQNDQPDFSLIDVHSWSSFADIGNSNDLTAEATTSGANKSGASAAALCQRRLPSNFKCISLQELIWRMRMKHNKEQTTKILNQYK